jgi:hypothetical protein
VGYYLGGCSYCFRYVTIRNAYEMMLIDSTAIPLCNCIRADFYRSSPRRNWRTRSDHAISPHSMLIRRYTPITSQCSNAPKSSTHVRKSTATTATAANETTTKPTRLQTTTERRCNETSSNGFRSSPRWTRTTRWNATTSTSNSICPKSSHFHIG